MAVNDIKTNYAPSDSEQFTTLLNADHTEIKTALLAGGTGGLGFDFFGNGRFVQNDMADGAPELPASPALAIVLPEGARLRIDGVDHTLADDVTLTGAPQNATAYCVPSATWDEGSESYEWDATWPTTRPDRGTGVVCKVTTDADEVLTVSSTLADSDVILWLPALIATLLTLSGVDGEGGFAYAGVAPWLPSPEDDRETSIVLEERFAAIMALIEAASGTGTRPHATKQDQLMQRIALLEQAVARFEREEARRYESAHVVLSDDTEVYGIGTGDDEDFVGPGLQPDAAGRFNT
jgi:hypothetical protein